MDKAEFERLSKVILEKHRQEIIDLAELHHKSEGRGMVQVQIEGEDEVSLSWIPLDQLLSTKSAEGVPESAYRKRQFETLTSYWPDNQVPIVVTDGQHESFSLRVKHAM